MVIKMMKEQKKNIKKLARYHIDPVLFGTEVLGSVYASYQIPIMDSVAENKKTAWRAAHGIGKTYVAADIALWFLLTRPYSKVITTASIWRQVKLLWNEIKQKISRADIKKMGWELKIDVLEMSIKLDSTWYAMGVASDDSSKIEGEHARDILYIVDEAKIVPKDTFTSIEGALTSEGAKLLVISTPPLNNEGYFYDIWALGKDFKKFHTSAFDSPNVRLERIVIPELVTKEWIEEREKEWGVNSPEYQAKVEGNFPTVTDDTLISYDWVERAIDREYNDDDLPELSCDVARFGSDKTIIMLGKGRKKKLIKELVKKDTMEVAGYINMLMRDKNAHLARIDELNMGAGAVDRLKEQNINIKAINVGEKAIDNERFANLRAEGYWNLREAFKDGEIDIEYDEQLVQELTGIKYKYNSKGQLMVESKDDIRKRLGRSPDKADTLMFFYIPIRIVNTDSMQTFGKSYTGSMKW